MHLINVETQIQIFFVCMVTHRTKVCQFFDHFVYDIMVLCNA